MRPLTHVRSWEKGETPITVIAPASTLKFSCTEQRNWPEHQHNLYSPPVSGRGKLTNLVDGDLPGSSKPSKARVYCKAELEASPQVSKTKY